MEKKKLLNKKRKNYNYYMVSHFPNTCLPFRLLSSAEVQNGVCVLRDQDNALSKMSVYTPLNLVDERSYSHLKSSLHGRNGRILGMHPKSSHSHPFSSVCHTGYFKSSVLYTPCYLHECTSLQRSGVLH